MSENRTASTETLVRSVTAHGMKWINQDDLLEWLNAERAAAVDGFADNHALIRFLNRAIDQTRKLL